MESCAILIVTPSAANNPSLAIAACRAGETGVLDLEHCRDPERARAALDDLERFTSTDFGVKLGPSCDEALVELLAHYPRCKTVLLAGGDHPAVASWIVRLRLMQALLLFEAVTLDEARRAEELGLDELVLKGNESGGRVGPESSAALVRHWQEARATGDLSLPAWVQGGIDLDSVASLQAAGVAGLVLDAQLLLTRESPLSEEQRGRLSSFTSGDTLCLGASCGQIYRFHSSCGREALEELRQEEERICSSATDSDERRQHWCSAVAAHLGHAGENGLWPLGEDAAHARVLAERYHTVAGIIQALHERLQGAVIPAEMQKERSSDVAIIGMACFLPRAGSLRGFWENILARVDAITEVPADHWDWRLYYDADPKAKDKISSRWGGFLDDMPFDPLSFGMPPSSLPSIEPVQLYALEAVRRALADAGYAQRPFDREHTAVILGAGGGAAQLAIGYSFRSYLPMLATVPGLEDRADDIVRHAHKLLPEWNEDSFPGILVNVIAGRVANRFNLGGPNFAVDAACGSSLAALYAGVRELETGSSNVAIVLGADTVQNPYTYLAFSKTHAFSPRGRCSTFDEAADGIVISEGVAAVVLKRLADAERDGDRIYAVIRGVGASSDGKDKGLTAPRPEGQLRALERAYAKAGISPARVGFVEAHGTGTVVGDQTEISSLGQVFRAAGAAGRGCAIGSVKSMIGHTKCAAGLAGLINATLALHHKVLPPLHITTPNHKARFEDSPFFLNSEPRPWVHGGPEARAAGVSAFGFGGTNFHAVLQEYTGSYLPQREAGLTHWPAELFVWRRPSIELLQTSVQQVQEALEHGAAPELASLAYSLWQACSHNPEHPVLAIVAGSHDELRQRLADALSGLHSSAAAMHDPRGICFAASPTRPGKVAFLFPGQGSQYPNMLAQLALAFPEVRQAFDEAERVLEGRLPRPLGKLIFPPSAFTPQEEAQARQALMQTAIAQPALGAASLAMLRLLSQLGVEPDVLGGHSYGDYVALCVAGALGRQELIHISHERGRIISAAAKDMPGGMAAIATDREGAAELIAGLEGLTIANLNSPQQTVIAGTGSGIEALLERCRRRGVRGQQLPVACGFHSALVAPAQEPFARVLAGCRFDAPRLPVYANTTAAPYPSEPGPLVELLAQHLVCPVRFQDEIEAMYAHGVRVFLEVGPQGVLTGLVGQTLRDRSHLALASDLKGRPGLVQLQHLLAQLLVTGLPMSLDRLFEGRPVQRYDLQNLVQSCAGPRPSPNTWLVNSVRVRPLHGPEPTLLGQAPAPAPAPSPSRAPAPLPQTPVHAMKANFVPLATSLTNGTALPPLPPVAAAVDDTAQVMLRFQDLMSRFLDTQRSVMLSYLQAGGVVSPTPAIPPSAYNGNGHIAADPPPTPTPPTPSPPMPPVPAPSPMPPEPTPAPPTPTPPVPQPIMPPVPPPPNPTMTGASPQREALTARLLQIVCHRTGYPVEMLDLDLDLEADLGIDSIKRVEILGLLAEAIEGGQGVHGSMETLTTIKTLRGIVDALLANHSNGATAGPSPGERAGIQRMLVTVCDAPEPADAGFDLPGGTLLLTDDGRGVARALAQRLEERGQKTVIVCPADHLADRGAGVVEANLSEPHGVEDLLARLHERWGAITGLVHLVPLGPSQSGESWPERMRRETRSLFLLARGLADELRRAAAHGSAVLLAATAMGGSFAVGETSLAEDFFPGQGGVAGLVKSLAHEWPEVRVRVVDFNGQAEEDTLAQQLLDELTTADGPVEVGYQEGRRITLHCVPAPLEADSPALELDPNSTILLTGGARGITAAVALELARRYRPNLILVGRSPLPEEAEGTATATLSDAAQLKGAIIARLRREGRPASPATVEAAYQRLLHEREIRSNLAALRQTGAHVHYYSADVRDEAALAAVLEDVRRRYSKIDGVIHGAGVIQDKLIRDKTLDSYERVFGTKVESALILSRLLRPDELRLCCFFASVAGRFGNRGQCDYAAANEVLSKLAAYLDQRWPGRVVSLVWGPWSSIGMVSELEQHLGQRGLQMISPELGVLFAEEELRLGRKGDWEVVIAGDVGQLACPQRPARTVALSERNGK